ncbi:hypothetical protein RCL_jg5966.t1 [Rhizophagus clarus]|uniref:Uncharacterized protein n=1 Tax=Rhizophagus clarus TaxID=94130 RepID=A0A8H3LWZ4_9GLOM|nr:hypothetical protein RCL_jg5966.t1 [Rhizophagus clarus]
MACVLNERVLLLTNDIQPKNMYNADQNMLMHFWYLDIWKWSGLYMSNWSNVLIANCGNWIISNIITASLWLCCLVHMYDEYNLA